MDGEKKSPARCDAQGDKAAAITADASIPRCDWFRQEAEAHGIKRKALYSLRDVAEVTGLSYTTVWEAADKGLFKTVKPEGIRRRLTRAEAAGMTALWVAIWAAMYGMAALMA